MPSYVNLSSDSGDLIGAGREYVYSNVDALITVTTEGSRLTISVEGDESWRGEFQLPGTYSELQPGSYVDLDRYPFHDPAVGGLSWSGESRDCNTLTGWIIIDSVTYDGADLTAIDLQFEQHCEGGAPALHGEIHWDADDPTIPPGPVSPLPEGLWEPAAGITPDNGDYIYLESEPGDHIGAGGNYLYTDLDSTVTMSGVDNHLSVSVDGNEKWIGDFRGIYDRSRLAVGYYGDLQDYPFHNPARGGLNWSAEGRSCNSLSGWFVVDSLTYDGAILTAIELRFEQFCDGASQALRGKIHLDVNDTTTAPGPVVPPPDNLWEPAPGIVPATGNYVYLESEPGEYIGAGGNYLYTQAVSQFLIDSGGAIFNVRINGVERWIGAFVGMDSLSRLEVGYYGDLERYPFHNPAKGGMQWSGQARGCGSLNGWFVVDSVTYNGTTLTAIDLRFEQYCSGASSALRGAIRWNAADTSTAPGPVVPPPAGLWQPAVGITPATANYVYLESQPGDFVGDGGTYLYTQANSVLSTNLTEAGVVVSVTGDERWAGSFAHMYSLSRLEVGYYDGMQSPANLAKGGMGWAGEGRGCNQLSGWFAVDSVTYVGETLTAIELRFEQHCEGVVPALRGAIRWNINDTTSPPDPIVPPPPGLWAPAPGATPASGNYVYMESQPGDYIGLGQTYLYRPDNSQIAVNSSGLYLGVSVNGDEHWGGEFEGMNTLSRLEAGYYGDLRGYPFHNPTKGGLSWGGQGRGCNTLTGWFVVDSVSYVGETLTAIELRFEQHCEGLAPALYGKIHWNQ